MPEDAFWVTCSQLSLESLDLLLVYQVDLLKHPLKVVLGCSILCTYIDTKLLSRWADNKCFIEFTSVILATGRELLDSKALA